MMKENTHTFFLFLLGVLEVFFVFLISFFYLFLFVFLFVFWVFWGIERQGDTTAIVELVPGQMIKHCMMPE